MSAEPISSCRVAFEGAQRCFCLLTCSQPQRRMSNSKDGRKAYPILCAGAQLWGRQRTDRRSTCKYIVKDRLTWGFQWEFDRVPSVNFHRSWEPHSEECILAREGSVIPTSEALGNSIKCEIPVYFRCIELNAGAEEYLAETVRVSSTWLLMKSPRLLTLGSLLSLRLRVPTELSGSPFSEVRGDGRVVSEHPLDDGSLAYKVAIDESVPRVNF